MLGGSGCVPPIASPEGQKSCSSFLKGREFASIALGSFGSAFVEVLVVEIGQLGP